MVLFIIICLLYAQLLYFSSTILNPWFLLFTKQYLLSSNFYGITVNWKKDRRDEISFEEEKTFSPWQHLRKLGMTLLVQWKYFSSEVFMCACLCAHIFVSACMCMCMWLPEVDGRRCFVPSLLILDGKCLPVLHPISYFKTGSFTDTGAHWFGKIGYQQAPGSFFLHLPGAGIKGRAFKECKTSKLRSSCWSTFLIDSPILGKFCGHRECFQYDTVKEVAETKRLDCNILTANIPLVFTMGVLSIMSSFRKDVYR